MSALSSKGNSLLTKIKDSGSLGKRVAKGATWVMIGTMSSKLFVFAATIIVARILSKETYGQLSIVRSTIQMFVSLSGFGIGATATKYIAQYRKDAPRKAIRMYGVANLFVWIMALTACTALVLCAQSLSADRLHEPSMAPDIMLGGVILFFTLLNGAQTGTLSGFEDFRRIANCQIVMGIAEIFLLCFGAYYGGLRGAIIGFGLTYGIAWAYNSYHIKKHLQSLGGNIIKELKDIHLADFKPIFTFSIPVAATSWIQMITYWWLKTSVINGAGFENMANYDIAEQWRTQMIFIPGIIATVILPILSNVKDKQSKRKVINLNIALNVGITVLFATLILFFGHYILILYGPSYTNAFPLYVLCWCAVFDSISSLSGTILMSSNNVVWALLTNLIKAGSLYVCYNFLLYYEMPLENNLAISYLVASTLQAISIIVVVKRLRLY